MSDREYPPEVIPQYIRDGLRRQDIETLRAIKSACERRIEQLEREAAESPGEDEVPDRGAESEVVEDEDLPDEIEEQLDELDQPRSSVSVQIVYKSCGDDCATCPKHGPYSYAYWREGGSVKSKYLGKPSA